MRVVLDTNSLLVSIGRRSRYRPIFDAFLTGKYQILVSTEILNEYEKIIAQKTNEIVADNILSLLSQSPDVDEINIYFKWGLIKEDADDNKFVDCALNGRANYLVTDDKHFNMLKHLGFPPLNVIGTSDSLALLQSE